jgi:hypothetical protein
MGKKDELFVCCPKNEKGIKALICSPVEIRKLFLWLHKNT